MRKVEKDDQEDAVDRVVRRLSKESEVARVRRQRTAVRDSVVISLHVEGGIGTLDLAPIEFTEKHRSSYVAAWAHVLAEVIRLKVKAAGGLRGPIGRRRP